VHCAIDGHTRLAYAEIHPDETAATCAALLRAAAAWFTYDIDRVEQATTGKRQSQPDQPRLSSSLADIGAHPRSTRSYWPQPNGKAERFNRTLTDEGPQSGPSTAQPSGPGPCPPDCTRATVAATLHSAASADQLYDNRRQAPLGIAPGAVDRPNLHGGRVLWTALQNRWCPCRRSMPVRPRRPVAPDTQHLNAGGGVQQSLERASGTHGGADTCAVRSVVRDRTTPSAAHARRPFDHAVASHCSR
jgi:hypothetical protein